MELGERHDPGRQRGNHRHARIGHGHLVRRLRELRPTGLQAERRRHREQCGDRAGQRDNRQRQHAQGRRQQRLRPAQRHERHRRRDDQRHAGSCRLQPDRGEAERQRNGDLGGQRDGNADRQLRRVREQHVSRRDRGRLRDGRLGEDRFEQSLSDRRQHLQRRDDDQQRNALRGQRGIERHARHWRGREQRRAGVLPERDDDGRQRDLRQRHAHANAGNARSHREQYVHGDHDDRRGSNGARGGNERHSGNRPGDLRLRGPLLPRRRVGVRSQRQPDRGQRDFGVPEAGAGGLGGSDPDRRQHVHRRHDGWLRQHPARGRRRHDRRPGGGRRPLLRLGRRHCRGRRSPGLQSQRQRDGEPCDQRRREHSTRGLRNADPHRHDFLGGRGDQRRHAARGRLGDGDQPAEQSRDAAGRRRRHLHPRRQADRGRRGKRLGRRGILDLDRAGNRDDNLRFRDIGRRPQLLSDCQRRSGGRPGDALRPAAEHELLPPRPSRASRRRRGDLRRRDGHHRARTGTGRGRHLGLLSDRRHPGERGVLWRADSPAGFHGLRDALRAARGDAPDAYGPRPAGSGVRVDRLDPARLPEHLQAGPFVVLRRVAPGGRAPGGGGIGLRSKHADNDRRRYHGVSHHALHRLPGSPCRPLDL